MTYVSLESGSASPTASVHNLATKCPSYRLGRVDVLIERGPLDTPCHIWQGATMWGYPCRRVNRVRMAEHRRAWIEAHGPIPEGYDVHHRCGQRRCINVDHLEILTRSEHLRLHRTGSLPDGVARVLIDQADRKHGILGEDARKRSPR